MGYIRHHAIVVTGGDHRGDAIRAHAKAVEIFPARQVTDVLPAAVNGYQTFLIGPDGSKEGWAESDEGNANRARFITWMREARMRDENPVWVDWVCVQYGDDERETKVDDHSDATPSPTPSGEP